MRTNCDICGKQFQSFIPKYEIHKYEDLCPGRVKRTKILELCHDCHDELKKFIKKGGDMNRKELAEKYGIDKEDVTCGKCKFGLVIVAGPPKFIHCDKRHAFGSDVWCESYEYKWGKEK